MRLNIKKGSLSDFFESARETAREIDQGKRVTRKNIIWVEPSDFISLLKTERAELIRYLRGKQQIYFSDLVAEIHRPVSGINRDLRLLSKYQLIRIFNEKKAGQGVCKVVEPMFGNQILEFKAEI